MSAWRFALLCLLAVPMQVWAGAPTVELRIENHVFVPDIVEIPADQKVRLMVINADSSPEEFESYELNREKVIAGGRRAVIFVGPLPAGDYPFFGEFNPKTAQGLLRVKGPADQ